MHHGPLMATINVI